MRLAMANQSIYKPKDSVANFSTTQRKGNHSTFRAQDSKLKLRAGEENIPVGQPRHKAQNSVGNNLNFRF